MLLMAMGRSNEILTDQIIAACSLVLTLKSPMICQYSWQSFCTHQLKLKAYYDQIAHPKSKPSFILTVGLYLFFGLTLFDVMDAMTGVSFASFFITYITYNNINTASTYICTSGTSILAF